MQQKIYNTIYGAIVGDALGVPVEFKEREWLSENPISIILILFAMHEDASAKDWEYSERQKERRHEELDDDSEDYDDFE